MKTCSAFLVSVSLLALVIAPKVSDAHTFLKKPFQQRYDFKTVTCYACHANGKDKNGKRLGKEVLNDLGKEMKKLLAKRKLTEQLEAAKKADPSTKKKLHEEITKEFVESLKQLDKLKTSKGKVWGELIKDGKIEGVKLKAAKKPAV